MENSALGHGGGGVAIDADSAQAIPTFVSCSFINNEATEGGAFHIEDPVAGGGFEGTAGADLINCLIADNEAQGHGGGFDCGCTENVNLTNCTVVNNVAGVNADGGAFWLEKGSDIFLKNCVLWDNSPDEIHILSGSADVIYSNVEGGYSGTGNINVQPDFKDALNGNYRYNTDSDGIDVGNNPDVPDDSNILEDTPDLDLFVRVVDGDEDSNSDVDMGAYEFQTCIWDLTGDCIVGTADLLELFAQWGTAGTADFDGSGAVGTADLPILFANWGLCYCAPPGATSLTIEQEMADACLTMDDWDNYVDVVTDPLSSQADKDRYQCWMEHYVKDCNKCFCLGQSGCPNPDPFN